MTIVGNKTDLCEDDEDRVVKTKDGAKLADVSLDYIQMCHPKLM